MEPLTKPNNDLDLFQLHNIFDGSVLISYKGPWEEGILFSFGKYVKVIAGGNEVVNKKIFRIFMELAQNISLYSAEYNEIAGKQVGIGSFVIAHFDNYYKVYCGNRVKTMDVIPIIDKCNVINALDREQLREFKRKQRKLPRSEFGGANVGLIQIALTADNPLDIVVTPLDDTYAFLSVNVKVCYDKTG
jgi:hypothetical protein